MKFHQLRTQEKEKENIKKQGTQENKTKRKNFIDPFPNIHSNFHYLSIYNYGRVTLKFKIFPFFIPSSPIYRPPSPLR